MNALSNGLKKERSWPGKPIDETVGEGRGAFWSFSMKSAIIWVYGVFKWTFQRYIHPKISFDFFSNLIQFGLASYLPTPHSQILQVFAVNFGLFSFHLINESFNLAQKFCTVEFVIQLRISVIQIRTYITQFNIFLIQDKKSVGSIQIRHYA